MKIVIHLLLLQKPVRRRRRQQQQLANEFYSDNILQIVYERI